MEKVLALSRVRSAAGATNLTPEDNRSTLCKIAGSRLMSGSGGGGFSVGGGGAVTDCEGLAFTTHVASPQAAVLSTLSRDDVLEVRLQTRGRGRVVGLFTSSGGFVGGVAAPQLERLRECLDSGTEYEATVISISGADVRVRIAVRGA